MMFCSCTSHRMMPSMATWLSGQLGMLPDPHARSDMVAACAGLPYGLSEAVRLLQEVDRPVLLVCGEKFSDKIGTVRPSRMIFGDGAAAMVIEPAPEGEPGDIDLLQTYASGPVSQVNSIIWPNPVFDNNITVFGPEVKSLAGRYLSQMIDELQAMPDPAGEQDSAWHTVELVVPHQANKTMVMKLAAERRAGRGQALLRHRDDGQHLVGEHPDRDRRCRRRGVIGRPTKIFAPGFGAGAVGGYSIMMIDPAVVVHAGAPGHPASSADDSAKTAADADIAAAAAADPDQSHASDDIKIAFS